MANAAIKVLSSHDCQNMRQANVLPANNPVACERLRAVEFSYKDLSGGGRGHGKVIVLDVVAADVQAIMDGLLERGFPLAKARPMEAYGGDDDASMDDNNTSAFNGRAITGGVLWSLHAYGVAIDLNPLQNPYVKFSSDGTAFIKPVGSALYAMNRLEYRPDKLPRPGLAEPVVDLFANHGFLHWGGYWDDRIDYQHFEIGSREFVTRLASLPPSAGAELWQGYVGAYRACRAQSPLSGDEARADCVSQVMRQFGPS